MKLQVTTNLHLNLVVYYNFKEHALELVGQKGFRDSLFLEAYASYKIPQVSNKYMLYFRNLDL